ncbi:FtsX-like permease family protein [Ornithinimicrobium murale]|uniref:FtsX-like permease family protein n=1 Tax=Ornithinimicrobium murale TaxID=1050153 RepID=UPI000E0D249C|nr:ABC transporter permease [Ornithinimicrobium murale]
MRHRLPHRASEVLAIVTAVLIGSVLASLCLVLLETGLRSPVPPQRLGSIDLVVGGEQSVPRAEDLDIALPEHVGVPTHLIREVANVPGVTAAAGDVSFPAAVSDGAGGFQPAPDPRRAGHGWDSLLGEIDLVGQAPRGAHDVVLDEMTAAAAGVSVGERVEVALGGEPRTMHLSGVVDRAGTTDNSGAASGVPGTILVSDDLARTLSPLAADTVDLITASTEPGSDPAVVADRVQQAVGPELVVSSGADLGSAERPAAAVTAGMLVLLVLSAGGVVVLLVGFITGGAVSVLAANRARELALLRAVGATPAQVRSLLARHASTVVLASSATGVAAGYGLAWWSQDALVGLGILVIGQEVSWSPWPALATVLLLWGVMQVAARAASWRVSTLPATTAVIETQSEPRAGGPLRTRAGAVLLVLALGTALAPLVTRTEAAIIGAASGALLAGIGVVLAAPAVVRRGAGWLAPRQRSVSGWLAVRNSGSFAVRTGGALAVLAVAVGLTVTQVFTTTTLSSVAAHEARASTIATAQVTADPVGGVPEGLVEEIARLPSVSAAVPVLRTSGVRTTSDGTQALTGAEPEQILAVGPGADEVLDLGVVDGTLTDLAGDTVAVATSLGWPHGIQVGDTLPLALADGTRVEPTVVATYRHGFGFGTVVASRDLVPAAAGPVDSVLVRGEDPGAVERDLSALVASHPGLETSDPLARAGTATQDPTVWISLGASVVLFGYLLLGVANRLVATTLRRRREWQLLESLGATHGQLWAMVAAETGLIALGATAAGLVISLVPMSLVALGFLGTPWPQGPLWVVAAIVLVVTATAAVATLVPTRHLLRARGALVLP